MTAMFRARLSIVGADDADASVGVAAFVFQEGYNTGWGGTATVVMQRRSGSTTTGRMTAGHLISGLMASGVQAGKPVGLQLLIHGGSLDGTVVRSWPCMVDQLESYESGRFVGCHVHLVDPVSFLAEQPVWGAYRSVSAAEAVGGALSLAAGGDGKPTVSPVLPKLPLVRVAAGYRTSLASIPYAIAAGQCLGDWLSELFALLGLRAELGVSADGGTIELGLLDSVPRRRPLAMTIVSPEDSDGASPRRAPPPMEDDSTTSMDPGNEPPDGPGPSSGAGRMLLTGHSGFPVAPIRGGLLDDPTLGSARAVYASGAIGTVLTGPGMDTEEASERIRGALLGTYAEMLTVSAVSGQPQVRPGDTIEPDRPLHTVGRWQVAGVRHTLRGGGYYNDLSLLRGDIAWRPDLPLSRSPDYVTGIVNGGQDFHIHEPVPRDRLGCIKISFPFTPSPVGQEAAEVAAADTTRDGKVMLDDFTADQIEDYEDNTAAWEAKAAQYRAGSFADPWPGRADDELTTEEMANRTAMSTKRTEALQYMAYKKARADRDLDGVISDRDTLISDELSAALQSGGHAAMQTRWNRRPETTPPETTAGSGNALLDEYGRLFEETDSTTPANVLAARKDAQEEADRWPPRIPLPIIKPMAGGMHGFITAHRHGDVCRVAVHNPLSAEIIGFQYRDDRKINSDLTEAVAGFVVEHDYDKAWSGMVFRRNDDAPAQSSDSSSTDSSSSTGS